MSVSWTCSTNDVRDASHSNRLPLFISWYNKDLRCICNSSNCITQSATVEHHSETHCTKRFSFPFGIPFGIPLGYFWDTSGLRDDITPARCYIINTQYHMCTKQCTALHCTYYGLTTAWYQSITPWTESKAPTTVSFSHHVPLHGICNSVWSPPRPFWLALEDRGGEAYKGKEVQPPTLRDSYHVLCWMGQVPTPCPLPPFLRRAHRNSGSTHKKKIS